MELANTCRCILVVCKKNGTEFLASYPLGQSCSIREQDLGAVRKQRSEVMKRLSPTGRRGDTVSSGAVKAKTDPCPKYDG